MYVTGDRSSHFVLVYSFSSISLMRCMYRDRVLQILLDLLDSSKKKKGKKNKNQAKKTEKKKPQRKLEACIKQSKTKHLSALGLHS